MAFPPLYFLHPATLLLQEEANWGTFRTIIAHSIGIILLSSFHNSRTLWGFLFWASLNCYTIKGKKIERPLNLSVDLHVLFSCSVITKCNDLTQYTSYHSHHGSMMTCPSTAFLSKRKRPLFPGKWVTMCVTVLPGALSLLYCTYMTTRRDSAFLLSYQCGCDNYYLRLTWSLFALTVLPLNAGAARTTEHRLF